MKAQNIFGEGPWTAAFTGTDGNTHNDGLTLAAARVLSEGSRGSSRGDGSQTAGGGYRPGVA